MESAVFECPEEGCTAVFTKYGNLERHLALGKHQLVPEKETLLDFAMERYAENIEGLREHSTPNTLKDALTTLPAGVLPFSNEKGWAIPSKKVYKKYNKDVVQFVMKKFEDSSKKKLKIYPKIIAKELREQKKDGTLQFAPDTWLNYKQISNLYHTFGRKSRELEEKKKKEKKTSKGNQSTGTQVPPTIPSSIRTPQNRASATRKPKTTSTGEESKTRSRRETTEKLVDLVLEELNQKEYDDSEEIYDEISEENQDFYHLIEEIEKEKKDIFDS
ncbi:hypothetical protein CRE_24850 [Caenorhabditis remanei]|uniref:C2H2-type domain-containing protein n=1 Tax=Caenorhabditis remanei TaxID=31234 RepID=E3NKX8_CAERE|nr:hypothetical protein CRE_24850 [Caenorhabditis remanei]